MRKEYTRDGLTVIWDQEKCVHSGICVNGLGDVFKPKEKPWIKMDAASTEAIRAQIEKCPSGALSYRMEGESGVETGDTETVVEIMENGPLLVYGTLKITRPDGSTELKNKTTAFCRCGASANKPYCDGAHKKIEFKG